MLILNNYFFSSGLRVLHGEPVAGDLRAGNQGRVRADRAKGAGTAAAGSTAAGTARGGGGGRRGGHTGKNCSSTITVRYFLAAYLWIQ